MSGTTELYEETKFHTRVMKCTLDVEHSRAYWSHCAATVGDVTTQDAFDKATFGTRSFPRVERLMADMRHRFDAFPFALALLKRWNRMSPEDRVLICHWHMQLADPLYRAFTGKLLVERFVGPRPTVDCDLVVHWIESLVPERWQLPTRIKIASKLMSSAMFAGLLASKRDPRSICIPRVSDTALTYAMYSLRQIKIEGSLVENPYLASVGLDFEALVARLRSLSALQFSRQDRLVDFGWRFDSLQSWAIGIGLIEPASSQRAAS